GGIAEMAQGFIARVRLLPLVDARPLDVLGVDRDFDLENIDAVLGLGKLFHALLDDLGFDLGVFHAFFVAALGIVADEFQEERDLIGFAFGADSFDEGVVAVGYRGIVEGRIVDQDLHGVGAPIDYAFDGDMGQQVGQAAGAGVV